jgi:hypothetical protein
MTSYCTVYAGTRLIGEVEDHLREGVRAFLGSGKGRKDLGLFSTRKEAMRAISAAAKAGKAAG